MAVDVTVSRVVMPVQPPDARRTPGERQPLARRCRLDGDAIPDPTTIARLPVQARLTLKRERLSELTARDLTHVVGGDAITANGFTCPLLRCDLGITDTSCECCTASGSC